MCVLQLKVQSLLLLRLVLMSKSNWVVYKWPYLDEQTTSRKSPHNWLVILGMDLASFCDMWSLKQPKLMLFA